MQLYIKTIITTAILYINDINAAVDAVHKLACFKLPFLCFFKVHIYTYIYW